MMKERILNLLSILIIIIYLCIWGYLVTIRTYYPKPKRSSEIPSNILWNSYEGEYYNSSDLKWNKKLKVYVPVSADYNHWYTDFSKTPSTHWREIHKTSGNIINRAIFKYLKTPAYGRLLRSPVYDPIWDNKLKEIDKLGIKAIPQILDKMITDYETSYILTNGLIFMTHVQTGPRDFRIKGSNLWVLSFVTKVKTSNASVKNAYRRFKLVISTEAKNKIKKRNCSLWYLWTTLCP